MLMSNRQGKHRQLVLVSGHHHSVRHPARQARRTQPQSEHAQAMRSRSVQGLRSACGRLRSACGRLRSACGRLRSACGRLRSACGRLRSACGRLRSACGRLRSACGRLRSACGRLRSACGRLRSACGRLCSACAAQVSTRAAQCMRWVQAQMPGALPDHPQQPQAYTCPYHSSAATDVCMPLGAHATRVCTPLELFTSRQGAPVRLSKRPYLILCLRPWLRWPHEGEQATSSSSMACSVHALGSCCSLHSGTPAHNMQPLNAW